MPVWRQLRGSYKRAFHETHWRFITKLLMKVNINKRFFFEISKKKYPQHGPSKPFHHLVFALFWRANSEKWGVRILFYPRKLSREP